jgi:rubrerythrin
MFLYRVIGNTLKKRYETMKAEDAKKIISTAIDREVEAYTFYRGVADKVKSPALKSLFSELAGE